MTRQEHLKWCKERAIVEMDYYHNSKQGIVSFLSDIRKHPETNNEVLASLAVGLMVAGKLNTRQAVIDFIDGCN